MTDSNSGTVCRRLVTKTGQYNSYQDQCGLLRDNDLHKPYGDGTFLYPRHPFEAEPAPAEQPPTCPTCGDEIGEGGATLEDIKNWKPGAVAASPAEGPRPEVIRPPFQKSLTIIITPDKSCEQADEDVDSILDNANSSIVRIGVLELYFHQLRLRTTKDPSLLDKIAVFYLDENNIFHEIGLRFEDELRWPPGFYQKGWELEIEIGRIRHPSPKNITPAAQPSPDAAKVEEIAERIREKVYDLWKRSRKASRTSFGQASWQGFVRDGIAAILRPYFPQVSAQFVQHQVEGNPSCHVCGTIMVRTVLDNSKAGWNCMSCGTTTGCGAGLAGEATQGPGQLWVRCHSCDSLLVYERTKPNEIKVYHNCPGKSSAPAAPEGAAPPDTIKADNLFGIYCSGNPLSVPTTPAIYWEGWQRLADWLNQRAVGEVADLKGANDRWMAEQDARKAAEAKLHDAVGFILALNEETVLAGFPGGDRNQTLANVRAMKAQLRTAREALGEIQMNHDQEGNWLRAEIALAALAPEETKR